METSQAITGALYAALGVQAEGSGTMNNVTFGNDRHQYYETVASGSGAGDGFDGTVVVQTHMTNSRLTDPEVLEWRYPVRLERYAIRPRQRRRGPLAGRRRRPPGAPLPRADDGDHAGQPPAGGALRDGGRLSPARSAGTGSSAPTARVPMRGCDCVEVAEGDVFVLETPGGGGYGQAVAEGRPGRGTMTGCESCVPRRIVSPACPISATRRAMRTSGGVRMAYVEAGPPAASRCCCCTASRAGRSSTAT